MEVLRRCLRHDSEHSLVSADISLGSHLLARKCCNSLGFVEFLVHGGGGQWPRCEPDYHQSGGG